MKRFKTTLNFLLLISFIVTIFAPLTGIHIHKMASTLFLLLTLVHTIVYRKTLGAKKISSALYCCHCFCKRFVWNDF